MKVAWTPSRQVELEYEQLAKTLVAYLPAILGIDEFIAGCQLIALDPFGVGVATVPRYVTVSINRYHQQVWYTGNLMLTVGHHYTVVHFRQGERYEILGPSGATGSYAPPATLYSNVVVDAVDTMEVVIDSITGEIVWI